MGNFVPALARVRVFFSALALLMLSPGRAAACATWTAVLYELRTLRNTAVVFHAARSDWPRDDGTLRWYEQIMLEPATEGFLDRYEIDACGPLDRWGHNVVYEPPPPGSPTSTLPIVRSVGVDGLDQCGKGDDLVAGGTVNPGSYGRPRESAFIAFATISPALLSLLVAFWRVRSGRFHIAMLPLATSWIGTSCVVGANLIWPAPSCCGRMFSPARELCDTGTFTLAGTLVISLICLVVQSAREARADALRLNRTKDGLCTSCGYDLHGLPDGRCPECSEVRPSSDPPPPTSAALSPASGAPPPSVPRRSTPA